MPDLIEHVVINCDRVTRFGKQFDRRFVALYWKMQASFGDRNYGRRVCLHEAAHATLMEQDGIRNVRFAGPDIIYDSFTDRFIPSAARAIGDDQPGAVVNDDYIFKIVCHMVAGGAALRLQGIAETGDDGDFADFRGRHSLNPPKSGETAEALWKRAQDAVTVRLNEPATAQKVRATSEVYFQLLYPVG